MMASTLGAMYSGMLPEVGVGEGVAGDALLDAGGILKGAVSQESVWYR
jgi:hypothetical protein